MDSLSSRMPSNQFLRWIWKRLFRVDTSTVQNSNIFTCTHVVPTSRHSTSIVTSSDNTTDVKCSGGIYMLSDLSLYAIDLYVYNLYQRFSNTTRWHEPFPDRGNAWNTSRLANGTHFVVHNSLDSSLRDLQNSGQKYLLKYNPMYSDVIILYSTTIWKKK